MRLQWSSECFVSFRLMLEQMAKGVAAGTVSIRTYHEAMSPQRKSSATGTPSRKRMTGASCIGATL